MQKLNGILKILIDNDELTPWSRKNQDPPYNRSKMGH